MKFDTNPDCKRSDRHPSTLISECGLYLIGPPEKEPRAPREWIVWSRLSLQEPWSLEGSSRSRREAEEMAVRRKEHQQKGSTMAELVFCPFCESTGARVIELDAWSSPGRWYAVLCHPGCQGKGPPAESKTEAIGRWNQRQQKGLG